MFQMFFCLDCDCEDNFSGIDTDGASCPFCGSKNVMEDNVSPTDEEAHVDWHDGHYEGDMHQRAPIDDGGDD